ncbi:MAG: septal ring lytic transglycosylase RlpA family protein [Burkholderiaceae bacterium]
MCWAARAGPLAPVLALVLSACGTTPSTPSSTTPGTTPTAAPNTAPRKSTYYQNDGPPDRVPADLAAIPDATPRVEPLHTRANRPYTALGKNYTPLTTDAPFQQRGLASWYGKQFHGNRTSSGEIYDMMGMTAAHPTLPIPSYVRVTEIRSGRSVIVRVNDRGPFKDDRIIDLSYAAATRLGYVNAGTGEVQVERLTMVQIASGDWRRSNDGPAVAGPAVIVPTTSVKAVGTAPPAAPSSSGPWTVQLGAFAQEANAEAFAGRAATLLAFIESADWPASQRTPRVERDQDVYRVLVGAWGDRSTALALAREAERVLERPTTVLAR